MKVLVMGAGGMLGSDLMAALEVRGHEAIGTARDSADVTDLSSILQLVQAVRPRAIINCAAFTRVDACETNPVLAFRVNATGAKNVAIAAQRIGATVMHISSDYVFDGLKGKPYIESDATSPSSVYGQSKCLGEFLVRSVCPQHIIVRTQWLFGANGPNFVKTMLELSRTQRQLRVVDDQVGSPTFTAHLAPALVELLETESVGTYHLTNSGHCSWYDFCKEIMEAANRVSTDVQPMASSELNRPARRPHYSVLANTVWLAEARQALPDYRDALRQYLRTGEV